MRNVYVLLCYSCSLMPDLCKWMSLFNPWYDLVSTKLETIKPLGHS